MPREEREGAIAYLDRRFSGVSNSLNRFRLSTLEHIINSIRETGSNPEDLSPEQRLAIAEGVLDYQEKAYLQEVLEIDEEGFRALAGELGRERVGHLFLEDSGLYDPRKKMAALQAYATLDTELMGKQLSATSSAFDSKLESVVKDGLKPSDIHDLKAELLQNFGRYNIALDPDKIQDPEVVPLYGQFSAYRALAEQITAAYGATPRAYN